MYDLLCISSFSPYVEETKEANQIKTVNASKIRILTSDELKNSTELIRVRASCNSKQVTEHFLCFQTGEQV